MNYFSMSKKEREAFDAKYVKELKDDYANYYSVNVVFEDAGNFGKKIRTQRTPVITVERCKEIVTNIERASGFKVKKITVNMSVWNMDNFTEKDVSSFIAGDPCNMDLIQNKKAIYSVEKNKLVIWENGYPIYENYNGVITKDRDALADCYL